MQNFSINSVLHFKNKEYQLRTSNNGRLNKIVCSLFKNGGFINSKEIEYTDKNETDLLARIKKFHEDRKKEIELFFNLSQRLKKEGNPELLNMLGVIFHSNNLHAEAVEEYLKAIEEAPKESQTFNNMGKALLAMGKFDHSIKAFEKAIRLNPDYVDYYNNLGKVYLKTGACKAAVEMFDKAITRNNYYAEAYFNRAIAYILNLIKKDSYELT
ncbi:tetratricopeptide repeat protein, partial [candidate division KSB1 bacterium]|nr:tetratricopeptide repeat protein [candidate division KSB1 bacterium]